MKSKKKLFEFLAKRFPHVTGEIKIGTYGISDETYGKTSCIYLWNIKEHWDICRAEMDTLLIGAGFKANRRYGKVNGVDAYGATEVAVSYFKGHHWDE